MLSGFLRESIRITCDRSPVPQIAKAMGSCQGSVALKCHPQVLLAGTSQGLAGLPGPRYAKGRVSEMTALLASYSCRSVIFYSIRRKPQGNPFGGTADMVLINMF